jgi:tRNA modification GTPase
MEDTIAAIATGMGEAGIAVVRISGRTAVATAARAFRSRRGASLEAARSHTLTYGWVVWPDGSVVDEVLAAVMHGPRSYTGEDVVEFHTHGGWVAVRRALDAVLAAGARLADPGEFTRRAFLNGRLDLAQAEAVIDIIRAKTERAMTVAVGQLSGALSDPVRRLRGDILEMTAHLEADIDFPELGLEVQTMASVESGCREVLSGIDRLLSGARQGRLLQEGLRVVIAGRPNVGKSSLLNRLVRENRAIVTDIPGTTRDVIEEWVNLNGIPVVFVDTAGIRETGELLEQLGVDRSREALRRADLVLFVVDAVSGILPEDQEVASSLPADRAVIGVVNKVDAAGAVLSDDVPELFKGAPTVALSALTGQGISELERLIAEAALGGRMSTSDILVANARHEEALRGARDHVTAALVSLEQGMGSDLVSIDLRAAYTDLGLITGDTAGEDLLDQIFSRFCIGK